MPWHREDTAPAPEWLPAEETERLPQPAQDAPLPTAPARPRPAVRRWRLPRFSDDRQRKAAKNLLRFFALVLVLTLVARGTAGATLPRVETTRAEAGDIVQKVRGTGTVKAGGSTTLEVPEGLTVEQVLPSPGQTLAPGDAVAQFDMDELTEKLQREENTLREMELTLQTLRRAPSLDGSALEAARRALTRAQEDQAIAQSQGEGEVAAARQALADAEDAEHKSKKHLAGIDDKTSQEYADAKADLAAKSADVAAKKEQAAQAQSQLDAALLAAARTLEDAQTSLASAEKADAEARTQAQDESAQNNVKAATQQLDIAAQQKKVDALKALVGSGGKLLAPEGGVVQELPAPGAKTGEGTAFRLADAAAGYEAELWLDQADAEKLAPGDACEVALSGGSMYYRPTAEGVVAAVDAAGEDGRAKVTLRLPQGEWKIGQTVEAQMVQDSQSHALCVPLSAIHSATDGYYVLVLQEQNTVLGLETVAAKVPVTVVAQDEQMAAIEGAVGGQEDIVTGSTKALEPGDKVRVEP